MEEWYFILEAKEGNYLMGPYADKGEAKDMSGLYGGGPPFQISEEQWKEIGKAEDIIRGDGHELK